MSQIITPLYQYYTETDGEALEGGKIYIGELGLDPETNPIATFFDSDLTIPAAQPLRTIGGLIDNAGTPSDVFVVAAYSITIRDVNDVLQFSNLDGQDLSGFLPLSGGNLTGPLTITTSQDEALKIDGSGDPFMGFYNSGVLKGTIAANETNFNIKGVVDIIADAPGVTIGNAVPNNSAKLDVQSTTKGFLPPRMTEVERDAIASPVAGLMVYNTNTTLYNVFDGTGWKDVGAVIVGSTTMWMTDNIPAGWIELDGSSLLRTGTYANLFAVLSTTYGAVDGTHFNLPDTRGQFPRFVDGGKGLDPNAGTRTDRGDGVVGDFAGTLQNEDTKSHTHAGTTVNAGNHQHAFTIGTKSTSVAGGANNNVTDQSSGQTGFAGDHNHTFVTDATGGAETRPVNIYVRLIMKF